MTCAAPNSCGHCQRTMPCLPGKCAWLIEEMYKAAVENTSFLPEPEKQYDPLFADSAGENNGT